MDGQRFDEVTKAFATGTSRRAVLRTALGGMSAGLLMIDDGMPSGRPLGTPYPRISDRLAEIARNARQREEVERASRPEDPSGHVGP